MSCLMKFKLFPKYLFNDIYLLYLYMTICIIATEEYNSTMGIAKCFSFLKNIKCPTHLTLLDIYTEVRKEKYIYWPDLD